MISAAATIEQGEAMPLQGGGHSATAPTSAPTRTMNNNRAASAIVRALRMLVGATVVMGALLVWMVAVHSNRILTNHSRSNVDSMVVVSTAATHEGPCLVPPAGTAFTPDNSRTYGCRKDPFETCYQYRNEAKYCWSKSYWSDYMGAFCRCAPIPYNPAGGNRQNWDSVDPKYVNPVTTPTTCGEPCTTMKQV